MSKRVALAFVACLGAAAATALTSAQTADKSGFTTTFGVEPGELVSTGRNPYFVLEPGYILEFAGGATHLTITVLKDTKTVAGVDTRVIEERETENGKLIEVSRNFFAISKRTNSVFYFGEDVDMYDKNGNVTSHEGSWTAGVGGATFGLAMPGEPLLKARYYQEIAPKVAMDRAEVVSLTETVQTPAGLFKDVLKTEETTPLEPLAREAKYYARGIGLIQDGSLKLIRRP